MTPEQPDDESEKNAPSADYLTSLWLEALRWPESETRLDRPYLAGSLEHCPACGGDAYELYNRRARRHEYICTEATCDARWCYKQGNTVKLERLT